MRKEFLDITGRDEKSSSITKWIEEKHGKELREYLATAPTIPSKQRRERNCNMIVNVVRLI